MSTTIKIRRQGAYIGLFTSYAVKINGNIVGNLGSGEEITVCVSESTCKLSIETNSNRSSKFYQKEVPVFINEPGVAGISCDIYTSGGLLQRRFDIQVSYLYCDVYHD